MNDVAIEQLMHDVLDGVASADEKARLEQRLAADPLLRERFRELEGMFDTLNRMPLVEAPEDLHAELMRTIERGQAARSRPSGFFATLADAFRARPVPAFAMTALTIAALALVLWSGAGRRDLRIAGNDSPVTGTMAPPAAADAVTLESGDARIRIAFIRENGALIATIGGRAASGAALEFGTGLTALNGSIEGAGATIGSHAAVAGSVRLDLQGDVDARLHIASESEAIGDIEVTLVTRAGASRHVFDLGRGIKRP